MSDEQTKAPPAKRFQASLAYLVVFCPVALYLAATFLIEVGSALGR